MPYAVRHIRICKTVACELLADAMRRVLDTKLGKLGVSRETAELVMGAAVDASFGLQRKAASAEETRMALAALREVIAAATQRDPSGTGYRRTCGQVGTNKKGAEFVLVALFNWGDVFSVVKLNGAKSRSASSDGCALNLSLLSKDDSGGRHKKGGRQKKWKTPAQQAPKREPVESVAGSVVTGGDFGQKGEEFAFAVVIRLSD